MSESVSSPGTIIPTTKRITKNYAGYVFFVLFCINFLNYVDRYILIGASTVIAKELHFGIDGIGYLASAFLIVSLVATLPLGIWADRAKRKTVIWVCVATWSAITALTGLSWNFASLLITRMGLGIGEAGYSPASGAMLADYFRRAVRACVLSWWWTSALLGTTGGIIIGGIVAGLGLGMWRWSFVWTGLAGLLFALLVLVMREPRRNEADEETWASDAARAPHGVSTTPESVQVRKALPLYSLLRVKSFIVLTVVWLFTSFNVGASATYLPTLLQQNDTFGFSSGVAALYTGIGFAVAGIIGVVMGGYVSDALRRRYPGARVLICGIGLLIGAPAYALAVFGAVNHNLIVFTIFFLLATLLNQMYIGPSNAAILDVVPSVIRASALAVSGFASSLLGGAFAPSIVGFLAGLFDPTHGQHFLHNTAGQDLTLALLVTCVPCLFLAGILGIIGARWVKADMLVAEQHDKFDS